MGIFQVGYGHPVAVPILTLKKFLFLKIQNQ
jgi:hypothetical protein